MKKKIATISLLVSALTCSIAVTALILSKSNKVDINKVNNNDPAPFIINEEVVARDDIFSDDNKSILGGYIGNNKDLKPKRLNDDKSDLSLTKPKIGYQVAYSDKDGNGVNDHISIRYTAAINSLNVDSAYWTRAMYKNNGDAFNSLKETNIEVTVAYSAIAHNGNISYATDVKDDLGNNSYNYYVLYTLLDIPLEGYGKYYLDASLTLTKGEESITSSVGATEVDTEDAFSYERGSLSSLIFTKKDNNTFKVRGNSASEEFNIVIPGYYNDGNGRYKVDEVEDRAFKQFYNLGCLEVPDVTYMGADIVTVTETKVLLRSSAPKAGWHPDFNEFNPMVFNYIGYYGVEDNIVYAISKDGDNLYATVIGAVYEDNYYDYAINSSYLSVPVTAISDYCFYETIANINTLDIPSTVKSIGKGAFDHYFGLQAITGCAGLEVIKDYAFYECHGLKSIPLSNVKTIGNYAFYYCNYLKDLLIFGNIESIGEYAFRECVGLSFIYLPDTLTNVGKGAFEHNDAAILAEASSKPNGWSNDFLGDNRDDRFASCNVYYNIKEGVTPFIYEQDNITYGIFESNSGNKLAVIMESDETAISGAIEVPQVINGAQVIAVMASAFSYVRATSILLPSTVTYIGPYAFSYCFNLETVSLGSITSLERYMFAESGNETDTGSNPIGIDNIMWPATLRTIKSRAFAKCLNEMIILPETITEIETEAFYGLYDSTVVVYIPDSVTTITGNMFIEETANNLYDYVPHAQIACASSAAKNGWAKHWDYGLRVYWNCYFDDEGYLTPPEEDYLENEDGYVYYLDEFGGAHLVSYYGSLSDLFKDDEGQYIGTIDNYPVVEICDFCFFEREQLKTITLPDTVKRIGTSAFRYTNLESISGAANLEIVGDYAFDHLSYLTNVKAFAEEYLITTVGDYAFNGCENMGALNVWDLEYIGEYAFNRCSWFKGDYQGIFPLRSSVQVVGKGAFANTNVFLVCEAVTKPAGWDNDMFADGTIESESVVYGVTDWGWDLQDNNNIDYFYYTVNNDVNQVYAVLTRAFNADGTSIVVPDTVYVEGAYFETNNGAQYKDLNVPITRVASEAFLGCSEITSIDLPDSVTTIGKSAFEACYQLQLLDLGRVETINDRTFAYTKSSLVINLPNSVRTIRKGAFDEARIRDLILPNSVLTIEEGAFFGADYLQNLFIPASVTTITGDIFGGYTQAASKRALFGATRYGEVIYCEVNNRPSGWDKRWSGTKEVVWGYSLPTD